MQVLSISTLLKLDSLIKNRKFEKMKISCNTLSEVKLEEYNPKIQETQLGFTEILSCEICQKW